MNDDDDKVGANMQEMLFNPRVPIRVGIDKLERICRCDREDAELLIREMLEHGMLHVDGIVSYAGMTSGRGHVDKGDGTFVLWLQERHTTPERVPLSSPTLWQEAKIDWLGNKISYGDLRVARAAFEGAELAQACRNLRARALGAGNQSAPEGEQPRSSGSAPKRGGRPPRKEWSEVDPEAARFLAESRDSGRDVTRSDLINHLDAWAAERWAKGIPLTTIESHVKEKWPDLP